MYIKKTQIVLTMFFAIILLTGCFNKEALEEVDVPPNEATTTSSEEATTDESTEENDRVARELYFIDASGLVASQIVELPLDASHKVATQVLEQLVVDGPGNATIPNGFRAVLPEGTEILGLNIQEDGIIVVDVSEEFSEYDPDDEVRILEAMTYSLTQFDNIDTMQLRIQGKDQMEMPANGTPIGNGYTRNRGINVLQTDTTDYTQSEAVTVYYPSEYNDTRYYVPVTQYVPQDTDDKYASLIESLIDGPKYSALQITHVFNPQTALTSKPVLEGGVLEIEFNDRILKDADEAIISDEVMETLVRTLTEDREIESVHVKVEHMETLQSETGELYDEPVTTDMFSPKEKI